jgi:exonuclease III
VPSLRLIAWNCRSGSLTTRLSELADESPDIVFVQECLPAVRHPLHKTFLSRSISTRKGIALRSLSPAYRVTKVAGRRAAGKAVIAATVAGPVSFTLLCIWAQAPAYAKDVMRSLEAYADVLRPGPTVVVGDLNSGTCLHRHEPVSRRHHTMIRALEASGLVSAYHTFHNIEHGQERHATYRHQFKDSQAWHIDFCFIPTTWATHLVDVRPLNGNEWEGRSDHFPLRVELRF